jgi:hypothetical protein
VLAAVRRALGAPAGAPLRVRRHPPPPSLVDRLRGRTHRDPAQEEIAALLAALPVDPAAVVDAVRAAGAVHGALSMPWVPRLR